MSDTDNAGNEGPGPGRRRRTPVIELEATEIGSEGHRARSETTRTKTGAAREGWRQRVAGAGGSLLVAPVMVAAIVGVLAGAVTALSLVLLLDRSADLRPDAAARRIESLPKRTEGQPGIPFEAGSIAPLVERMDRIAGAIADVEKRLAALESRPIGSSPANDPRSAELESTLARLRDALADLDARAGKAQSGATSALEALTRRIAGLEERIGSLAQPSRPPTRPTGVAELAALMALSGAVATGRPFTRELDAARKILGERAAPLAPFEPDASTGLPTVAALADRFSALAPAMIRAPNPEGDFLSRLLGNAARLVEVRPVGEPEGREVGAVVARMEARLGRGDLAGALSEVPLLPEAARTVSADWVAVAIRRRDAERTVKTLIDTVLAASERTTP